MLPSTYVSTGTLPQLSSRWESTDRARPPYDVGVLLNQGINSHVIPHFLCTVGFSYEGARWWVGALSPPLAKCTAVNLLSLTQARSLVGTRRLSLGGDFRDVPRQEQDPSLIGCVSQASGNCTGDRLSTRARPVVVRMQILDN